MKEKDEQSSAQGKQVDRKGGTSWEGGDEGLESESDSQCFLAIDPFLRRLKT